MHMMINFIKSTIQFLCFALVIEFLFKLFLKRTFVGRLINSICKDIWLFLKLNFRIFKHTIKLINKDTKKLNNIMYKQYKKFDSNKKEKKVVNENNNIIDLNDVKKKYNK
jgi:hypothetical protein